MNPLQRLLLRHLEEGRGDRVACVDSTGVEITYEGLHRAARAYAAALENLGVRPGSRGVVVSDDCAAAVVAVLGLWWHGSIPVPASPELREEELVFLVEDCSAALVHLDMSESKAAALDDRLEGVARIDGAQVRRYLTDGSPGQLGGGGDAGEPAMTPDDQEVLVQYTSGSTGTPRGVRHSAGGIDAVLDGFGTVLQLQPEDTVLSTAKVSFGYGFGNSVLFPLAAGARSVLLAGPVDPFTVAVALRRHRPTVLCAVPRVYSGLVDLAAKNGAVEADSVRIGVSAGEHLPAELSRLIAGTFGFPLINGLGATEALHIVVCTRPPGPADGSTGLPVPGVTATVRDGKGELQPDGVEGRLHVATASAALGYIDRPEATAHTFTDGGLYTGDIVHRADDGDLRHICRSDDLLNLGGHKVSPLEIETVLRRTESVKDCAVSATRDEAGLGQATAYVVPNEGVDHDELRRAVRATLRARLAPHKRPTHIELIGALPTTSTGKLARFKLRDPQGQR